MTDDPWSADLWAAITLRCKTVEQFNDLRMLATAAYSEIGGTITREMAEKAAVAFTQKVEALGLRAPVVDVDELRDRLFTQKPARRRKKL